MKPQPRQTDTVRLIPGGIEMKRRHRDDVPLVRLETPSNDKLRKFYTADGRSPWYDPVCRYEPDLGQRRGLDPIFSLRGRFGSFPRIPRETLLERRWRELSTSRQLGTLLLVVLGVTALIAEALS